MNRTRKGQRISTLGKVLTALAALALVASGCGGEVATVEDLPVTTEAPHLLVVTTTTILGDLARNVVGDHARVEVLMPLGADPHGYQPSARQVALLLEADLVVANGLLLEEGLAGVLASAAADGANVLEIGEFLSPLPFGGDGHNDADDHDDDGGHPDDDGDGNGHGDHDPHFWMDPVRMAEAARLIAAELSRIEPGVDWAEGADSYAAELNAADARIREILQGIPGDRRKLVTNHEAFTYFAARYGFEVVGVVIPGGSALADPSSAQLASLVETMRDEGVRAIFAETTQSAELAEAVAAELGGEARVVRLYTGSLGEPGSGADSLIAMLTTNAERIAAALS
jgi:zinc/manganese transport system substrate-binding protein